MCTYTYIHIHIHIYIYIYRSTSESNNKEVLLEEHSGATIMQMLRDISLYITSRDDTKFASTNSKSKRLITSRKVSSNDKNTAEDTISK